MRDDIEIQADVLAEIRWDPKIKASHIGVEVAEGVVTLSGYVESYSEKINAEKAAKRVRGVRAIAQEIKVLLPGSSTRSDTEIARQMQSIIAWSSIDPHEQIHVKVEQGFITLGGKVEAFHQKDLAQSYASNMLGVTGVCNLIEVEPKLSGPIIKQDIQNALARQAIDQAQKLDITIDQNIVTIAGKVKSWSERNSAINAAWSIPTVKNVIDHLQVGY
jgi:osmotically-inducible protein OsmY